LVTHKCTKGPAENTIPPASLDWLSRGIHIFLTTLPNNDGLCFFVFIFTYLLYPYCAVETCVMRRRIRFLLSVQCYAMHGQNICVCVCVRHTFCQLTYRSDPSTDFNKILYTAADFELDECHVIKNEKVALDRLRVRQNVFLIK